jgi:hypothetical protein
MINYIFFFFHFTIQLSLSLLTSICRSNPGMMPHTREKLLPQLLQLLRSPLLQGDYDYYIVLLSLWLQHDLTLHPRLKNISSRIYLALFIFMGNLTQSKKKYI